MSLGAGPYQAERKRNCGSITSTYIRSLHKVVDQSDILLLVLDARDPEGYRSRLHFKTERTVHHEQYDFPKVNHTTGECAMQATRVDVHTLSRLANISAA